MPRALYSTHLLWLVLWLSLLVNAARAAGPASSCDDDLTCKKLAAQGITSFGVGRYEEAEEHFAQAYALRADPALLYNLGRTVHKAGRPREAVRYYQQFLESGAAGDAEQRRKAQQYLSQAQKESASPLVTPPLPLSGPTPTPSGSAIQSPPSAEPPRAPLYRKPWLWAIVGVVVAGAAVGLGVGLAARRPDLSDTLDARPFAN